MARVTQIVGAVLVVIGVVAYAATGAASLTALLPAALGFVIGALGVVAQRIEAGRHAIHAALALALVGGLAALPRIAGVTDGDGAAIASLLTVVVCAVYVGMGVRSFVAARRSRQGAA